MTRSHVGNDVIHLCSLFSSGHLKQYQDSSDGWPCYYQPIDVTDVTLDSGDSVDARHRRIIILVTHNLRRHL